MTHDKDVALSCDWHFAICIVRKLTASRLHGPRPKKPWLLHVNNKGADKQIDQRLY